MKPFVSQKNGNKKILRVCLCLFVCLCVMQFTLGYIEAYFTSYTGNEGTWKTAPEGILVILGQFVLYEFTKC
ncbi:DUF3937 family protein [Bacillus cereus group sp. MYBK132-2]|uniref:DUF3937 family protein n=1 Tax=unclassified Bacillus cereus group TaxID=2750818 RepID=UPI001124DDD7|nr:DUF3937 family protein [Bacillus cereus]